MKKLFIMITALMAVAIFATSSFASNEVQMTLTSPTIYKAGCEKIGSTTYSFDAGSVISSGDWWYMDLPQNVTLCKSYNFVVAGMNATAYPTVQINAGLNPYQNVAFDKNSSIGSLTSGSTGPFSTSGEDGICTADGNIAFLVKGVKGTRRVTIYALTDTTTATTLTAGSKSTMQLKLFDGKSWSKTNDTATNTTRILLNRVQVTGDTIYGQVGTTAGTNDEVIGGNASIDAVAGAPYVENTLCSNNEEMETQYLQTSYASKSDKFTFSGDSQIAHVASENAITLKACNEKGAIAYDILLNNTQSAHACWFAYDNVAVTANANGNYCETSATVWGALGQRFLIEALNGFGDIDDKYSVSAQITSPSDGVYFSDAPTVKLFKSTDDDCVDDGITPTPTPVFTAYLGGTTLAAAYAPTTCTIDATKRVTKVAQTAATVFKVDNGAVSYDTIMIDMPAFAFGSTLVEAGEAVTVSVSLDRYPCGTIFTGTRTIGTFVTICGAVAGQTTLRYPWLPGTAAAGWWGGYAITNFGTTAGTAILTYRDSNGNTATYTTPSIAANAQWVNSAVTSADLANTVVASPYDPTLNFSVSAACAFTAKGFAFTGNGTEGVGYSVDN